MTARVLLTGSFLLCLSYFTYSQEYSYTHYDISDGLAGSVVYCITQDRDGFIWTGTETGVSRFDGTHFKTFTVADGLPDIEILQLFGDSKGRIWMAPFRKSICYYYHGKIHNQDNDSVLHTIHLQGNVQNFVEDAAGNVLIQERTALHLMMADGRLRHFDSIAGQPIRECMAISRSASGNFLVQEGQQVFAFSAGVFSVYCPIPLMHYDPRFLAISPAGMIWRKDGVHSAMYCFATGGTVVRHFNLNHYNHVSFTSIGDSLFYDNEQSGATEYNLYTGSTKQFLPGKEISKTFRDAMGNTWFTTLGEGIYRLNSDEFRTVRLNFEGINAAVYAIKRIGNELYVGDNHNIIYTFSLPGVSNEHIITCGNSGRNRVLFIDRRPDGVVIQGGDVGISYLCDMCFYCNLALGVKAVCRLNDRELIVGSHSGVFRVDWQHLKVLDTLWRERCTTIYYKNDTCYIGTLNGCYRLAPDRTASFLGKTIPFLQKRISAIAESPDGTIWFASYDAGAVAFREGRIIATLTKQSGLTSDICRAMYIEGQVLWIGTDKGLNKVELDRPGFPVTRYTSNDGLASDMINSVYSDSSTTYVGTSAGFSYFDKTKVNTSEGCRLHLLSIVNSGKERVDDSAHLLIPYQDKHIRLEFAGISYRSVGSIRYRYRMLGLDSTWQETKETFLEYPTLPSGKYVFQLQATNKFGIQSALLTVPFEVATPFWQAIWFYAFLGGLFLSLTWAFVSLRIRQIRKRQSEREELNQRLTEMEHMALQAQMNPHFIFNCLSSIQQYIFSQDVLEANRYLTGFARLIRATLHHSTRPFITLGAEIDYLDTYLSLEKLRFKEKMDYQIIVDPAIDVQQAMIPPMLIQPYVENAMRHGLRHKTTGKGYIRVWFALGADKLSVTVEDNGIGRRAAAAYKTREHIEYQSRGMNLTADRIRLMNVKYNNGIYITVTDLQDDAGAAAGTRVVMYFPLFHLTDQNESIYDPNSTRG